MHVRKTSDWQFETSSTFGLSAGLAGGEGGTLSLTDPGGVDVTLHYVALGAGLSFALKTPGNLNASLAPGAFPNAGTVLILDSFHGDELSRSDLTGVCSIAEVAGGAVIGGTASVLLLGMTYMRAPIDTALMFGGPVPALLDRLGVVDEIWHVSAKAMVIVGGATTYTGAGISGFSGVVW